MVVHLWNLINGCALLEADAVPTSVNKERPSKNDFSSSVR